MLGALRGRRGRPPLPIVNGIDCAALAAGGRAAVALSEFRGRHPGGDVGGTGWAMVGGGEPPPHDSGALAVLLLRPSAAGLTSLDLA